jgi:hypothetical protein
VRHLARRRFEFSGKGTEIAAARFEQSMKRRQLDRSEEAYPLRVLGAANHLP